MIITSSHALEAALESSITLNHIFISKSLKSKRLEKIKILCKQKNILYKFVPAEAIDRKAGYTKNQGVFAETSPVNFLKIKEITGNIKTGIILILNNILDPHNLGAIIRTAVAAEVDGIILSKRNTAPINETVLKTSAGNLLKARLVISNNLAADIDYLKKKEFWIIGTDIKEGIKYYNYDFSYKTAIIIGSENKGLSPLLRKKVDQIVTIPHSSRVNSLNVSVAAGIILFEAGRQKH